MKKSYTSIVGLPVVVIRTNSKIATVKDVLFCCKKRIVFGLLIEEKRLLGITKYIPLDEIEQINKTSIVVSSLNCIKEVKSSDGMYKIISDAKRCSLGTSVYTKNGKRIGQIRDIIFDFEIGTIDSYIISDGIIEDLISGRKLLPNIQTFFRRNNIYISD